MGTHIFLFGPCFFIAVIQILGASADSLSELRLDFAEHEAKLEEFAKNVTAERKEINSRMNLVLKALAKDGYLADILQGPEGQKGERGERGAVGPPGPPGPSVDLTPLKVRLAAVEKVLRDTAEEVSPKIFFATEGRGVKGYSAFISDVRTVISSIENVEGLAWDSMNQQFYYSTAGKIHRASLKGDQTDTASSVLRVPQYEKIYGLAVDGITGNLYGVSWNGLVFVCKTEVNAAPQSCTTLLNNNEKLGGMTLSPKDGTMYWTLYDSGKILQAQMDGTGVNVIVTGLGKPGGIVLDTESGRLFWTEYGSHKIQSSNAAGGELRKVLQLSKDAGPWGIILTEGRIYWGNYENKTLQSCTKSGNDPRLLYEGPKGINQLTFAAGNVPPNRINDCEDSQILPGSLYSASCFPPNSNFIPYPLVPCFPCHPACVTKCFTRGFGRCCHWYSERKKRSGGFCNAALFKF